MSGAGGRLRVVAPGEELKLTPGAARVLLRILLKAAARAKQSQAARKGQEK
ncbi:hypothetical protein SMD20_31730 [Nonomuraea sp. LP-02]|uniref:hypothetical protein n=1 Tax=Nonomuraea sp. LP-02 TaxID=3097960 RepID=UPI002E36B31C|nr:hypothetical protein [Nonomuraea sp. LP-02]MED7928857.1 hypothetical protein [Nonomuraea sp. LP-02]